MDSAGGLTRRRGGGRGATAADDNNDGSRVASPNPRNGSPYDNSAPETSFTGGENGHKIAFDPRDMSENEERSKLPKLTLMEEVLLLGLKDKQVWFCAGLPLRFQYILCLSARGNCVYDLRFGEISKLVSEILTDCFLCDLLGIPIFLE
jgi:hypothetical protein